jgi:hypothetical protein
MVLGAIAAESVAAYDETTGRPLELLWGILFFAPLYGGPAALIREAARRARLGWPTMVLASGQSAGPDAARAGWAGAIRCRFARDASVSPDADGALAFGVEAVAATSGDASRADAA